MISEIVQLKNNGLSIKQIAEELDTSVGKIQYRWNKYRKAQEESVQSENENTVIKKVELKSNAKFENKVYDHAVLMVQSPTTLFCYWELSEKKRHIIEHQLNQQWSNLEKKIRIYDITAKHFNGHNANRYYDYRIPDVCQQWFFYDLSPNTTFCVDIGVTTNQGNFLSIIRSNAIDTPRLSRDQVGIHSDSVNKWKEGHSNEPEWLEGFSSYSYYEKLN